MVPDYYADRPGKRAVIGLVSIIAVLLAFGLALGVSGCVQ